MWSEKQIIICVIIFGFCQIALLWTNPLVLLMFLADSNHVFFFSLFIPTPLWIFANIALMLFLTVASKSNRKISTMLTMGFIFILNQIVILTLLVLVLGVPLKLSLYPITIPQMLMGFVLSVLQIYLSFNYLIMKNALKSNPTRKYEIPFLVVIATNIIFPLQIRLDDLLVSLFRFPPPPVWDYFYEPFLCFLLFSLPFLGFALVGFFLRRRWPILLYGLAMTLFHLVTNKWWVLLLANPIAFIWVAKIYDIKLGMLEGLILKLGTSNPFPQTSHHAIWRKKSPQTPVMGSEKMVEFSHAYDHKELLGKRSSLRTVITPEDQQIEIRTGYDVVGENAKFAIKVQNEGSTIIADVKVVLDVPSAFELTMDSEPIQMLGNIPPESFQSAIFWLKPLRCVDDEVGGTLIYKDIHGESHSIQIPPRRIVNICPMLSPTERVDDVFRKLKFNALARNCASYQFRGNAKTVFVLAQSRLVGLQSVEKTEQELEDGTYLGYACYVGQTKYGEQQFAAEIQVTGRPGTGLLTLTIYAEDERILSGFFVDIMTEIRKHIEIIEEQACPIATCPKCGANIDPLKIGENRIYHCEYCGTIFKVAPWLV